MILALASCLLVPHLVQSIPWGPAPPAERRIPPPWERYAPPSYQAPRKEENNYFEPAKPNYGEPKVNYQPKDTYVEPAKPNYGDPQEKYQPKDSYVEPAKPNYSQPDVKYEPKDTYVEPAKPNYGQPEVNYQPKESYVEPAKPNYGEPGLKYQPKNTYVEPTEQPYEESMNEYQPKEEDSYYEEKEPEFAAVIIGDCDKTRGIEASEVYSPNVKSSVVPASPLDTCTLPAGVFYNDSLIVCGGGSQATGTPCYTNKIGCDTWEQMAPMKEYRERFTMTVVDSYNALVVVGGFKCTNDVEIFYDGRWLAGPKHEGVHGLVNHGAVSYGQNKVMVIGGLLKRKPTDNVFTIDISNGRVEKVASLNFKRYSHASTRASWGGIDFIIVAGGFQDYCVSNTVEFIEASANGYMKPTWKMLAPMNIKRFDFGLALYGSQLAAIGGQPSIESEHIEVYDPETDCWKIVSQCIAHPERQFFTAITVPDSYFNEPPQETPSYTEPPSYDTTEPSYDNSPYLEPPSYTNAPYEESKDQEYATVLVGGCDNDEGIKDSELYSPNLESEIIPASPVPTCTKPAGVFYNGSLVVCGGVKEGQGTPCYANEIGSQEWKEFCPLNECRDRFTMTVVESCNALVVVGGFKSGKDVEIYKDGKWQQGPELRKDQGLVHHCSVQYNNKVMVTGGFCSGKPTDMVQTIDVVTNQVEDLASLNSKRYAHSCIATSWGGEDYVVVAGGFQDFSVSNTVEFLSTKMDGYSAPVWKTLPPMNIKRFDFGLGIYGKKLAAFGGQPTIESDKIEVYCPETKCWKLVGRSIVNPERHFFTTITVPESYFQQKQGYY